MNAPAPLYELVKRHITDGIVSGDFRPGEKLPSENELVRALQVSRMTVNRALRELVRDGIIDRVQGVGSFVRQGGTGASLSEVRDIRDIVAERGGTHSCTVISARSEVAGPEVAELMELRPGDRVFALEIVNHEDGQPLQYERRFVRESFAPDLLAHDFEAESLFKYLQGVAPLSELEHVVEAGLPDADEAWYLALEPSEPVLRIRRRTWVGDRVVTLGTFTHPADRYRVAVRLRPSDVAG